MTYGYKTLDDGTVVPYPIDTQLPTNMTKLTNSDIDILKILIEQNLKKSEILQMDSEDHFKPEILQQISKKLDRMYFQ
jgi:hypothetical protein